MYIRNVLSHKKHQVATKRVGKTSCFVGALTGTVGGYNSLHLLRCVIRNLTVVTCQPENTSLSVDKDIGLDHGTDETCFQTLRDLVLELLDDLDPNAIGETDIISLPRAQRGSL